MILPRTLVSFIISINFRVNQKYYSIAKLELASVNHYKKLHSHMYWQEFY